MSDVRITDDGNFKFTNIESRNYSIKDFITFVTNLIANESNFNLKGNGVIDRDPAGEPALHDLLKMMVESDGTKPINFQGASYQFFKKYLPKNRKLNFDKEFVQFDSIAQYVKSLKNPYMELLRFRSEEG